MENFVVSKFIHLHLHTKYSILDGMCKFEHIVEAAKKNNMMAVAATEHGNMYSAVEFYSAMVRAGIKPLIGLETYVVEDVKKNQRKKNHLVLLVKNEEGYKNLIKISSFGFTDGFYYKPSVDKAFLREHSAGLIALSSCVQGEIPNRIIGGDYDGARAAAEQYLSMFGEGNFYLELQNHGLEEELISNRGLRELASAMSIPLVATNDVHYMTREDAKAHDILLCIQTGKNLKDSDRMSFKTNEFYFKNYDEMLKTLPGDREAIENTFHIAEKCNFELPKPPNNKPYYMPSYKIDGWDGSYDEYFDKTTREALALKYAEITPEIRDRFEHEVGIIKKMEYSGYFLIVREIINYARSNNIPVGPGRGSAAGSLVSYILGITSIDPIKYGLLFERFLNPERISPPDIDIDFSDEGRAAVINFIVNKFGKDKVAQIVTFQTLKPRQAIRDVARVLGVPISEADMLAKKVPEGPTVSFEEVLKDDNFVSFVNNDTVREEIVNYAVKIEGLLRQDSTHAAGVVIAPEVLTNYVPIGVPKESEGGIALNYMTQYPMESLEKIGLLKFDILGLRNLTVIRDTLEYIRENRGQDITLETSGFDNPEVYELFSSGNTLGVFQLESSGMRDLLKKIRPTCLEDIIAVNSLFRPGPMKMIDEYIRRKKGIDKVTYDFPELEDVLKETYGIAIYQEQVMQIAVKIAGFTMAQADNLRRAMSKKKASEMEKIKKSFLEGAAKRSIPQRSAEELFDKLEQFSQYGFNKSHSAAYAVLAYQTGYLKALYPHEYMAALLTSVMDRTDKAAFYVEDCAANGIKVLPPDANKSDIGFRVERNAVRYGLAAVKNVGVLAGAEIVKTRKEKGAYTDIYDFCEKVNLRTVTTKTVESLVKSGAFDYTLAHRAQVYACINDAVKKAESSQKDLAIGQFNLFETDISDHKLPDIPEWIESELLTYEKDVLGFYISSHPLARYRKLLENVSQPIHELLHGKADNGESVIIGGIVHALARKITPRGDERIHFHLEGLSGRIKVIAGDKFDRKKNNIFNDNIMFMVRGRLVFMEDEPFVSMESVITLDEAYTTLGKYLHITLHELGLDEMVMQEIRNLIRSSPGPTETIFHIITRDNKEATALLGPEDRVTVNDEILLKLENLAGEGNVRLSWKK
jgi:DNA polymerase-3 subunit alpha